MIYRIDKFEESRINPITAREYDTSWIILILTDSNDYEKMCGSNNECAYTVKKIYKTHTYNDPFLRDNEPNILIHSTPMHNWEQIKYDGMFGEGVTGEIVVNSKQSGIIEMDIDNEYITGARMYFDAKRMAQDGLLIRDGCHIKVKDTLPLNPYLIWTATWENIGLDSQVSTPEIFSKKSDHQFKNIFNM